jgi:hypothetical protein
MSDEAQPIGQRLDALGIRSTMEDGDLISSAVVIMSVLPEGSGDPFLRVCFSEGMSWIERYGMLHAAAISEESDMRNDTVRDEED